MSRAVTIAAAMNLEAILVGSPAAAEDKPAATQHQFGPAPEWSAYKQIAESTIAARMTDPESARIHWSGGFYQGTFKPFLEPRVTGYVACGLVNAKNRLGGYNGYSAFVVVIDYGRVLYADIDSGPQVGMIGEACIKAQQQGLLPPVPANDAAAGVPERSPRATMADATLTTQTGLTLRAMPEGAYVTAVAPGSAGATAGLKPGMVIASVNAVPLASMGEAMIKVVDAAGSAATLAIIGGATIKLGGAK